MVPKIEILRWVAGKDERDHVYDIKAGELGFKIKFDPCFPWEAGGALADPIYKVAGISDDQISRLGGEVFLRGLYGLCLAYRKETPPVVDDVKPETSTDHSFLLMSEEDEPL